MIEREITEPVRLTTTTGDLDPAALGWSRTPLHDTSGIGPGTPHRVRFWGREKRWEYWNVMTPTHVLAFTLSCIDYLSLHSVWLLDRASGETSERTVLTPLSRGTALPPSLGDWPARARAHRLVLDVDEIGSPVPEISGTRLRGVTDRVRFDIVAQRPPGHESLGVVVPWRRHRRVPRFQYTVKDVARPASGTIVVDGVAHHLPEGSAWAVLDHGRGRWPYRVHWNWAAGSGFVEGRSIGLQLGSRWTDGSGATENALVVDGRLTKISEELVWDYDPADWMRPWRITGACADLTLRPFHRKHSRTQAQPCDPAVRPAQTGRSGRAGAEPGRRPAPRRSVGCSELPRQRRSPW